MELAPYVFFSFEDCDTTRVVSVASRYTCYSNSCRLSAGLDKLNAAAVEVSSMQTEV